MLQATGQVIAGIAVLVLAGVLLVTRGRIQRKSADRRAEAPESALVLHDDNSGGMVDLAGRVVSPNALRAPASGRSCSLWELSLIRVAPPSYDSNAGYTTIWVGARCGDLVVAYDERIVVTLDPKTGRPSFMKGGPGRVDVPGDKVTIIMPGEPPDKPVPALSMFGGSGYQPANASVLQEAGVPAELLAQVRANPAGFVVSEGSVATGEYVRLFQPPSANAGSGPDPDKPFHVYPFGQDLGAAGCGCLAGFLAVVAAIAAIAGAGLLLAGASQLIGGQ